MVEMEPKSELVVVDLKQSYTKPEQPDTEAAPGSTYYIDELAERRLVRKLDLNILPLVMVIYLVSFLDRVNIGNARLFGLEEDLNLHGNQYQTAVSLLFVTYLVRYSSKHYARHSISALTMDYSSSKLPVTSFSNACSPSDISLQRVFLGELWPHSPGWYKTLAALLYADSCLAHWSLASFLP